ncbi:hypothetical protein [Sphingomonas sp. PAMC 26617]|uniref:hypothetical protein n=1 Tax=Sphingomonas sp. PAMC 26617 TaxID=1112216 RepID=UPI00028A3758|nr:hypothetical protein [Sphingomonas sp. PAMC 26617]
MPNRVARTATRERRLRAAQQDKDGMTNRIDWRPLAPGLRAIIRGDRPITRMQIYGQRCSGTNIVAQTLAANIPELQLTDAFGHKHWFVAAQTLFPADTLSVVVARDAFDWVRSLHRQPWHAHPDLKAKPFAAFVRSEWNSCWDEHFDHIEPGHPLLGQEMLHERDPATGERFANCIAKRTAKLRHWADLPMRAHNVALVSYDGFMRAPEAVVAALATATGLERTPIFQTVTSYKGQGFFAYVPQRYDDLAPADVAHIEGWLDPAVEAQYGLRATYAMESPPSE